MFQGSETSIFGHKSNLHRPTDDVGDRSSCSVGDVAIGQSMQDSATSSVVNLADPAPNPVMGAKRPTHVSENDHSEHRTSYI